MGNKDKAAITLLFAVILSYASCIDEKDKYTTKYDNIDVDAIINSPRLLKNYVDCVLDRGHCTPDGLELKKNIPDAIQTDCSKCSEKQKQLTDKVICYLIENEAEYWKTIQVKYDPSGSYTKKHFDSKKA